MYNLEELKRELDATPYNAKGNTMSRYAEMWGVSEKTLYRRLAEKYPSNRVRTKSEKKIDNKYIDVIAKIKAPKYGQDEREISTEHAIRQAEIEGKIPFGLLKKSTVDTRLRENKFREVKVYSRIDYGFVNQVQFLDWSRSEYITPVEYSRQEQDYILKTSERSLRYKNKQTDEIMSLWVLGLKEPVSGVKHHRYYMTTGENMNVSLDFLMFCWNRPEDDHPLNNPPLFLHNDNGATGSSDPFERSLNAIDVQQKNCLPYNKKAMGQIEREWRSLWQRFELPFLSLKGKGYTFTLGNLNEMVFQFCLDEMERENVRQKGVSRRVVYERGMLASPQRKLDADLRRLAYWPKRCKVLGDLSFTYKGQTYKAPDRYYGQYVVVEENGAGDLIASGEEDKKVFEITDFRPNVYGQYKSPPDTYREKMLKEAKSEQKLIKMKPYHKTIEVKSRFVHNEKEEDFSLEEAKLYIVTRLSLDSYDPVREIFDPLLAVSTKKEDIDEALKPLKVKAV